MTLRSLTTISLAALALGAPLAQAESFTGSTYTKVARFEHPLDTYESCSKRSHAGSIAYEDAARDALLACRRGYNADCVEIGVAFRSVMSREFIGYKYCEAAVTVHGYRMGGTFGLPTNVN